MTHASLCKKTYKKVEWLHSTKSRRMDRMRTLIIAVLLSLASLGVASAQCGVGISPSSVPNATAGVAYDVQLTYSGVPMGTPVAWSASGVPPGLNVNTVTTASSTTISGTPTTLGTFYFTVTAQYNDSAPSCATQNYSITVIAACSPVLSPASPLPAADVNILYP